METLALTLQLVAEGNLSLRLCKNENQHENMEISQQQSKFID